MDNEKQEKAEGRRQITENELAAAREWYGSVDIAIDADAIVVDTSDGGRWVQAWVYLYP